MTKQSLLEKLSKLFDQSEKYQDYEGLAVSFSKKKGATTSQLNLLSSLPVNVPQDYIDFLIHFNGCTLFKFQDLGGFDLLGSADLERGNQIQKETYQEDWDDKIVVFCTLICDGDFIAFKFLDNGKYEIIDCYHDDLPNNWISIESSFDDFLEKLIDAKGKRYWL